MAALGNQITASHASTTRTERQVTEMRELLERQKDTHNPPNEDNPQKPPRGTGPGQIMDPATTAKYIVPQAIPSQLGIYVAICYAAAHDLSTRELRDLIARAAKTRLLAKGITALAAESVSQWYEGKGAGQLDLLMDLDIVETQRRERAEGETGTREFGVQVIEPFRKAVEQERAKYKPEPEKLRTLDPVSIEDEIARLS